MMFVSMGGDGGECPDAVPIENSLKVRCCIALNSQHVERVRLLGDFCASGEELVLTESQPGLWIARLLLQAGHYHCMITAQKVLGRRNCVDINPGLFRLHVILTIPDLREQGLHVPKLDLVDKRDSSKSSRRGHEEDHAPSTSCSIGLNDSTITAAFESRHISPGGA